MPVMSLRCLVTDPSLRSITCTACLYGCQQQHMPAGIWTLQPQAWITVCTFHGALNFEKFSHSLMVLCSFPCIHMTMQLGCRLEHTHSQGPHMRWPKQLRTFHSKGPSYGHQHGEGESDKPCLLALQSNLRGCQALLTVSEFVAVR